MRSDEDDDHLFEDYIAHFYNFIEWESSEIILVDLEESDKFEENY